MGFFSCLKAFHRYERCYLLQVANITHWASTKNCEIENPAILLFFLTYLLVILIYTIILFSISSYYIIFVIISWQTSACEKVIRRDIARTYPEHDFFREKDGLGQESLFNVMKVWFLYMCFGWYWYTRCGMNMWKSIRKCVLNEVVWWRVTHIASVLVNDALNCVC